MWSYAAQTIPLFIAAAQAFGRVHTAAVFLQLATDTILTTTAANNISGMPNLVHGPTTYVVLRTMRASYTSQGWPLQHAYGDFGLSEAQHCAFGHCSRVGLNGAPLRAAAASILLPGQGPMSNRPRIAARVERHGASP